MLGSVYTSNQAGVNRHGQIVGTRRFEYSLSVQLFNAQEPEQCEAES